MNVLQKLVVVVVVGGGGILTFRRPYLQNFPPLHVQKKKKVFYYRVLSQVFLLKLSLRRFEGLMQKLIGLEFISEHIFSLQLVWPWTAVIMLNNTGIFRIQHVQI